MGEMRLSVLLIGHPKLRNDLRRPQMEEIGYRTTTFEGVSGDRAWEFMEKLRGTEAPV